MTASTTIFVFDFDSTLVTLESFDELLNLALGEQLEKTALQAKITAITDAGMNGEIDLAESLTRRLELAQISQIHIDATIALLVSSITPGIEKVIAHLHARGDKVCIMSGGFLEMILPIAKTLSIATENCFANEFYKTDGIVTGIDFANPLSRSSGKAETIAKLTANSNADVICIGDGMSDAIPFLQGVATEFWGFFQNVDRPKVREKATRSFESSAELLEHLQHF